MRPINNYVVFSTDTLFNANAGFRGVNGEEVILNTDFDPAKNVRCYGQVESIPLHLTRRPITQEHRGSPSYHHESPFEYKFLSDVEQEVTVGSRIYFHFNTICAKNLVKVEGKHPNRKWFYKVSYDQIICVVKDNEIIPIASFVLCDPDFESWEDILLPIKSGLKGKDGEDLFLPKEKWIQTKTKPDYKFLLAFVRHIGKPFRGDKCEVDINQRIWYRRNADWMNKIEGKDYFVIRQRHITGKEVDGKFVPIRGHMLVIPEPDPSETASGIILKQRLTKKGIVYHPGDSDYPEGLRIQFGESDRQEIVLYGEKFLLIKKRDVFATHERTVKP